jgi:hypothetical protein
MQTEGRTGRGGRGVRRARGLCKARAPRGEKKSAGMLRGQSWRCERREKATKAAILPLGRARGGCVRALWWEVRGPGVGAPTNECRLWARYTDSRRQVRPCLGPHVWPEQVLNARGRQQARPGPRGGAAHSGAGGGRMRGRLRRPHGLAAGSQGRSGNTGEQHAKGLCGPRALRCCVNCLPARRAAIKGWW